MAALDDIESDLSAIHRVSDMWSMPSAQFVRLVERLWHYQGAIRERVGIGLMRDATGSVSAQPVGPGASGVEVVGSNRAELSSHAAFADLIEWG